MTPSNPDNQQPLIYRIADAAGVFHLVAPVNHTHTYDDVPGLAADLAAKANAAATETALAGKQNILTFDLTPTADSTNPVTSGGVKAALDSKSNLVGQTISLVINGQEIEIESSDVPNLIRALSDPDSTPIANSNNLVTSGSVKAALDNKRTLVGQTISLVISGQEIEIDSSDVPNLIRALSDPDSTPIANSNNLVTSGGVKTALDGKAPEGDTEVIFEEGENIFVYLPNYFTNGERQRSFILNYQGEAAELIDLFRCDTNDTIRILSHDDSTITVGECYIAVRVIKQQGGATQGNIYYIIFDGRNDY